jgi:hypothetical protein
MNATHNINGHLIALDKIVLIGPIISVRCDDAMAAIEFNLAPHETAYYFELFTMGIEKPFRFTTKDLDRTKTSRALLVQAYNDFMQITAPRRLPWPETAGD